MFKLNIECTRDFDELHIVFSDGSSTVVTNKRNDDSHQVSNSEKRAKKQSKSNEQKLDDTLDTDADWGCINQDIVEKPVISERKRPIKVAEELQNLDI